MFLIDESIDKWKSCTEHINIFFLKDTLNEWGQDACYTDALQISCHDWFDCWATHLQRHSFQSQVIQYYHTHFFRYEETSFVTMHLQDWWTCIWKSLSLSFVLFTDTWSQGIQNHASQCLQSTISDIKETNNMGSQPGNCIIFLKGLCGCIRVNMLPLSPLRVCKRNVAKWSQHLSFELYKSKSPDWIPLAGHMHKSWSNLSPHTASMYPVVMSTWLNYNWQYITGLHSFWKR